MATSGIAGMFTAVTGDTLSRTARMLFPQLSGSLHKGQCGRICVIGGSKEYTGAPYFAAICALKLGADLSHVICPAEAAPVIKAYSPELIVHPLLNNESNLDEINEWLSKFHAVVIGPGLGRRTELETSLLQPIFQKVAELQLPLVVDADGLFYVTKHPEWVSGNLKAVLTPNAVEFERLQVAVLGNKNKSVAELAQCMGNVTIIRKGSSDRISDGLELVEVKETGCLRRCGGQGDVLSGTLGTFMAWAWRKGAPELPVHKSVAAAYSACVLTRKCSKKAYELCRRSMTTTEMLAVFPGVVREMEGADPSYS